MIVITVIACHHLRGPVLMTHIMQQNRRLIPCCHHVISTFEKNRKKFRYAHICKSADDVMTLVFFLNVSIDLALSSAPITLGGDRR